MPARIEPYGGWMSEAKFQISSPNEFRQFRGNRFCLRLMTGQQNAQRHRISRSQVAFPARKGSNDGVCLCGQKQSASASWG